MASHPAVNNGQSLASDGVSAVALAASVAASLADLDPTHLAPLAERLAPLIAERLGGSNLQEENRWMDTREAASYLAMSPNALHKLTAARSIPFTQDGLGCKCWFRKSELDVWRRGQS